MRSQQIFSICSGRGGRIECTVAGNFCSLSPWILCGPRGSKSIPAMSNFAGPRTQGAHGPTIWGPGPAYIIESLRASPTHAVTQSAVSPLSRSTSPRNPPASWIRPGCRSAAATLHRSTPYSSSPEPCFTGKKKDSRTKIPVFRPVSPEPRFPEKKERFSRESKIPVFRPVSLIRWLPLVGGEPSFHQPVRERRAVAAPYRLQRAVAADWLGVPL